MTTTVFDPADPDFLEQQLGFDNAFSLTVATEITGQPVVVNPTTYGHGYLFNDLAVEDVVPYHEGMHSISTPIAGFEEGLEAPALNEGQADLWSATISGDPSLGEYIVNGFRLRRAIREGTLFTAANGNADLVAWIRNATPAIHTESRTGMRPPPNPRAVRTTVSYEPRSLVCDDPLEHRNSITTG